MTLSILNDKRVLVVEDNNINQMLVKHTLQSTGAALDFADDGLIAFEKAKNNTYDLILMDLQLPEMDGYEVARKVRKELKSDITIIAMSAMMFLGEEQKCDDAGMNGYILKPFSLESLYEAMEKVQVKKEKEQEQSADHIIKADGLTLDTSMLYNLGGTDTSYLKLVVQTFLESMSGVIVKLKNAYEQKDFEVLGKTAHFAKSSLSVVKVEELFNMMMQLEQQCKTKTDLDTIGDKLEWVYTAYPKAEKILQRIFEIPEATAQKVVQ